MQFPTPYIRHFCLSRSSCTFLQRRASTFRPAPVQETQPFTFIASHFATDVRRISVYILLIVKNFLLRRQAALAQETHPFTSITSHFATDVRRIPVYILLIVMARMR